MQRREAIDFLLKTPYKLGHLIGFTDIGKLHNRWIVDMVLGDEDATLQGHRGCYKTTSVSIALAVIMVVFPRLRLMFMRKTDSDVKEVLAQVKKILLSEQLRIFCRAIWGVDIALSKSSATEITTNLTADVKGTAQLVGIGCGSSLTGKHFDRIFTDDIVNVNDRVSRAERDRTKLVYQELQNIKNRGGRIFNTGTPWHKDDAFSIMPPAEKWDCYSTGLLTKQQIADLKSRMTASLFAANYELRHIAEDDAIFDNPQLGADTSLVEQGYSHVDAAYYGEDYTAFTVINYHDGKFYVFGKCWRKHIDDVQDTIIQIHNDLKAGKMYIETNGDKGYVERAIRKKGLRVVGYTESQNKYIKITSHLKGVWKDVVFVKGTDDEYINQITDYNENAEHDDCPDSLASIIREVGVRLSKKRPEDAIDYSRMSVHERIMML